MGFLPLVVRIYKITDLLTHYCLITTKACPGVTGFPFSATTLTTVPLTSASISFINFIASRMQTGCPA